MKVESVEIAAKRQVRVRLFAIARDLAGAAMVELELPTAATVADLRKGLVARYPQLVAFGSSLRFAIDSDYADDATPLPASGEIACIPPVSGG